MFLKKYTNNLCIAVFGLLAVLFFLPGCLPFSIKTGDDFSLAKGDRISMLFCSQDRRWLVLLNVHDGVPFPKEGRFMTLMLTGEGEDVKTSSGDGRKFTRLIDPIDNLDSAMGAVKSGYVIIYEKNQRVEINIKTEEWFARGFNGTHRFTVMGTRPLLDDVDVPAIKDFSKAGTAKQLSMIKNATGSIKGIPLRDILISYLVNRGIWSTYTSDKVTYTELTEFQEKYRDSPDPVAELYFPVNRVSVSRPVFKYKDGDATAEALEQAFDRAIKAPRSQGKDFDFDRDVMKKDRN